MHTTNKWMNSKKRTKTNEPSSVQWCVNKTAQPIGIGQSYFCFIALPKTLGAIIDRLIDARFQGQVLETGQ